MMRPGIYYATLAAMILGFGIGGRTAFSDIWPEPYKKEYQSSERSFLFRVSPSAAPSEHLGDCLGELIHCNGQEESLVWRRHLINDIAPVAAVVASSGKYVVTMDEWLHFGDLPIVIYGARGDLIAVHNLEEIVNPFDGKYDGINLSVVPSISGPNCAQHSLIFFGPNDETLFIRLSAGTIRIIQLADGRIMTDGWHRNQVERGIQQISREKWKSLMDFGKSRTAELAVEYLASPSGWHRETGAMIVGQVRIRDAIPRLQVLASGDAAYLSRIDETNRRRKLYFVRRAAANALVAMAEEPPKGAVFEEVTPEVAEPAIEWWWHDTTTSGSAQDAVGDPRP